MGLCSSINVKMIDNPLDDDKKKTPQPQTKEALKTMIENYNEGKKSYGESNTWDVTLVTDMSQLFWGMEKFNAPIDQWNTSEVTDMSHMFYGASSFNQPITMDTSKVVNMSSMFMNASSFNQPITMDTSKVTNMFGMFEGADAMTHPHPIRLNVRHFFFLVTLIIYERRGQ